MRKVIVFGILISITFISLPAATAKVENGKPCSKFGDVQIIGASKFTCTKSGKKLIWRVASTSTTNSSLPQYPTELSPITQRAYSDFINLYKSRLTQEEPNLNFIVAPNTDETMLKQVKDNVTAAARFFSTERPLNVPTNIWVAMTTSFQFIYDNVSAVLPQQRLNGGWLDAKLARAKDQCGFMGGGAPGDAKDGTAVLFYNFGCNSNWGDAFWSQVPEHEFTHVVQRYELGGDVAPMLCWVREGNANFYGWMLAGRNSQAAYRNFWLQALSKIPTMGEVPDYQSKSADYWTNFFIQNESLNAAQCDPWINYILGAMAFQYLAGTYGNQAITNFYQGLKDSWKGVCDSALGADGLACKSWKAVFKKSFGITPEEAYPKFGEFIANEIRWSKDKQVLWNADALGIAPIPTT